MKVIRFSTMKSPSRKVTYCQRHMAQSNTPSPVLQDSAAAKSLQSCPTLCDPTDGSPPGSPRPWYSPGKNTAVGR